MEKDIIQWDNDKKTITKHFQMETIQARRQMSDIV